MPPERSTESQSERYAVSSALSTGYLYASPADIIRNGGEIVFSNDSQQRLRVRSDFPVQLVLDGHPVGIVGAATGRYPSPWVTIERDVRVVAVRLAPGYGQGGEAEAYVRHGLCVIESAGGDQVEQNDVDVDKLPVHTYKFIQAIAGAASGITTVNLGVANFQINGRLPAEFYLEAVVGRRTDQATGLHMAGIWSLEAIKRDVPVGDLKRLFAVGNDAPAAAAGAAFGCFYNQLRLKIPLAAIFSAYVAETPEISFIYTIEANASATNLNTWLVGRVRW